MKIFPAIDLRDGKVVRLLKGDYDQMTVYGDDPLTTARGFADCGAEYIHIVDLDGAKDGGTPNMDVIKAIAEGTDLKVEVGGGIRSEEVIAAYRDAGVWRVIIGTAAVEQPEWTAEMIGKYGRAIAVGADVADGRIAVRGWKEITDVSLDQLMADLSRLGASGVICTDISKDGAMEGTNLPLYRSLSAKYSLDIVASGGVSTMDDVRKLKEMGVFGAIIGKALYSGAIDLREAIEEAR